MKTAKHLILLLVLHSTGDVLSQTCSSLGNQLSRTRFFSSWSEGYGGPYHKGTLLDLSRTAACGGKGVAWNYCFYLGWTSSVTVQRAHLLVYRKTGPSSYTRVDGSETIVNIYDQYASRQWYCDRVVLTFPFDVLEGDVIGVCLPDPSNTEPLDVFESVPGYQLFHKIVPEEYLPRCNNDDINILDISSRWHTHTSGALNVHLEISSGQMSSMVSSELVLPTTSHTTSSWLTVLPTTSHTSSSWLTVLPTTIHTSSSWLTVLPTTSYVSSLWPTVLPTNSHTSSSWATVLTTVQSETVTRDTTIVQPTPSTEGNVSAVTPEVVATVIAESQGDKLQDDFTSLLSLESLAGVAVGGILVLCTLPLCVLTAAYCIRKRKREAQYCTSSTSFHKGIVITNLQHRDSSGHVGSSNANSRLQQLEELQFMDAQRYSEPAASASQLFTQLQQFEVNIIPREKVEMTHPLSHGQFTVVNRAIWLDSLGMIREVAVKSIRPTSPAEERMRLLREATVMVQFNHSKVIQLYGVIIKNDQVMLVMELAKNGNLQSYLQALSESDMEIERLNLEMTKEFLNFSKDVAMGMYYLSQKRFIHKNIAAHSIFLTTAKSCKIGNFSASGARDEIPVRWTAPEVLTSKLYSTATDIWSYGCLLYEIWSVGALPLEELQHFQVATRVELGYRMSRPPGCPIDIYNIMKQCWQQDPHTRPSFREILIVLLQFEDTLQHNCNNHPDSSDIGLPAQLPRHIPTVDARSTSTDKDEAESVVYEDIDSDEDSTDMDDEPVYDDISVSSPHQYVNDQNMYYNSCL